MPSAALVTIATRHQSHYERLKSAEVAKFDKFLKKLDKGVRAQLSAVDITEFSRTRLEKQLTQIKALLKGTMSDYAKVWHDSIEEVALYEADFERRALEKVVDGVEFAMPSDKQITAAVFNSPLGDISGPDGGALLDSFVEDMSARTVKRVEGAIRLGYAQGQTTAQILQRVRGTRAAGFRDGILSNVKRDAESITRTALQHAASQAREAVWKENSSVVKKVRIIATLDNLTSTVCRAIDGQEYPIDEGPRPPFHVNACLAGTLITTARGSVSIEDVQVGDYVLTHRGRFRRVYTVMSRRHDGACRSLVNNFGARVRLTNEHPVLTRNKGWIEAGDVDLSDVVFQNPEQLNGLPDARSALVPQRILTDAHNIKTCLTEELISYGIFSSTRGMSSSVNLNRSGADKEVCNVSISDNGLMGIFDTASVENGHSKPLVFGRCGPESKGEPLADRRDMTRDLGRIVDFHSIRAFAASLFMPFRILLRPMPVSGRSFDKALAILNRLAPCFDVNPVSFAHTIQRAWTKAKLFFDIANASISRPVFGLDDVHDEIFGESGLSHWVASTVSSIEEYHYTGHVYNLAVDEDETYVAEGIVVHNCRTGTTVVLDDKFSFLSEGRTRSERDPETGEVGRVSANQTYYGWLKTQPANVQDSIIGPSRGQLLRDGGLSSERFSELQLGKNFEPLTLEQMRELDPVAFERAGL